MCGLPAFGLGAVRWGGLLLLLSGLLDILDGQVARQGALASTFGAFYDSTLDRIGESALFAGVAVHFLRDGVPARWLTPAVGVTIAALSASLLVSYTRARAEGLGLECKVGIAARAERILILGAPALLLGGRDWRLLPAIMAILALATTITVVQRIVHVARTSGGVRTERVSSSRRRDTLPGHTALRKGS